MWAACTALTFVLGRLGAQDTPATPWGGAAPTWSEHMLFWDGGWYWRILSEGYPSVLPVGSDGVVAQNAWAFMPLQPYLARALMTLGPSFAVAACLVSVTSSATAAVLADRWLAPHVGRRASLWAVALAWCGPCALVLQSPYAESLGLALTTGVLLLAARRRFLAAIPLVALVAVARPVGLPLAAALGLWWLWETVRSRPSLARACDRLLDETPSMSAPQRLRLAVLTASALAATAVWPLVAGWVTGRPDAYTATETAWRGGSLAPFVPWLDRSGWWVGAHLGPVLLVAVLALTWMGLASRPLRALGPSAWFWCLGYVLYLLVFFDPTTSLLRLLMPLLPVAWAVAATARSLSPRATRALLVGAVAWQAVWIAWVWDLGSVTIQWVP